MPTATRCCAWTRCGFRRSTTSSSATSTRRGERGRARRKSALPHGRRRRRRARARRREVGRDAWPRAEHDRGVDGEVSAAERTEAGEGDATLDLVAGLIREIVLEDWIWELPI